MRTLDFEQIWTMEDYIRDMDFIADKAFEDSEQIEFIKSHGYKPIIFKYTDITQDVLHYTVRFHLPDEFITLLLLKYPEGRTKWEA